MNSSRPLSDSPFYYVLRFSLFGLFALLIIHFSGRYEARQTAIEQKYHGIQQIQRTAGEQAVSDVDGQPIEPAGYKLVGPHEQPLKITLMPLIVTMSLVTLGAAIGLAWERSRRRREQQDDEPSSEQETQA